MCGVDKNNKHIPDIDTCKFTLYKSCKYFAGIDTANFISN